MLSAFFRDNSFLLQQSQTVRYSYKYSKFLELFIEVTFQETFQSKEIYNNNFLVFSSTLLLGDHDNKNDLYDKEPEGNTICHDGRIQVWTQTYASSVWKNSSHY